jgi:hypothetical protein
MRPLPSARPTHVGPLAALLVTLVATLLLAAETVAGSLYLAVFIARLVGLHMAQRGRDLDL